MVATDPLEELLVDISAIQTQDTYFLTHGAQVYHASKDWWRTVCDQAIEAFQPASAKPSLSQHSSVREAVKAGVYCSLCERRLNAVRPAGC